jgi:hypothetical protein
MSTGDIFTFQGKVVVRTACSTFRHPLNRLPFIRKLIKRFLDVTCSDVSG